MPMLKSLGHRQSPHATYDRPRLRRHRNRRHDTYAPAQTTVPAAREVPPRKSSRCALMACK
jgi:hypothetical protein